MAIESTAMSFSQRIQAAYASLSDLNCFNESAPTDTKVYTLVVIGRLLQAFSAIGTAASIAASIIWGPLTLYGMIPSIATLIFGTMCAESPFEVLGSRLFRSFQEGQPIGIPNQNFDCWMIASLQLMMNVPEYKQALSQIAPFTDFVNLYDQAQLNRQRVANNISTSQLRSSFKATTLGSWINEHNSQEDAQEFIEKITSNANLVYEIIEREYPLNEPHNLSVIRVPIPEQTEQRNLAHMLRSYFDQPTQFSSENKLSFKAAPGQLIIQIGRFGHQTNGQGQAQTEKYNHHIEAPFRFVLPADIAQQEATYECNGFIVHRGSTIQKGHYVAYIKKNDAWWFCGDSSTYEVSESHVKAAMRNGYIFNYSRINHTHFN